MSESLEDVVQRVYQKLAENQEPLGSEFRQVLEENLWDLYDDSGDCDLWDKVDEDEDIF